MPGSRKRRGAVACMLGASLGACFVALGATRSQPGSTRSQPWSVTVRGLPPRVAAGETNAFWAAVKNAASKNKIAAEEYVEKIDEQAEAHIYSGEVVGRERTIEALMQSMNQTGLTLVLGGKNLGKTLLVNEAINRCKQWATRAVQGLGAVIGRAVNGAVATGALDVALQEKQVNIEKFIKKTVRSGRIPSVVVDEATLAIPGVSGEANAAAKAALAAITKWTKQTHEASFMLISSQFDYPSLLDECGLHFGTIGRVIIIGEVPESEMLEMLEERWGMEKELAQLFYAYFGGDIYTSKQALESLKRRTKNFDPFAVSICIGLPSCAKDTFARAHLENIAKQGFSFVENVEADAGARMIAQQNFGGSIGGVIHRSDITFGLPDIFKGTNYQYAVIPESYHKRVLVAESLENHPRP